VYRHILNQLEEVAGSKAPYVFAIGGTVLVLALILLLLPPWRRAVKAAMDRGGWRGILLGAVHVILTLIIGATVVEALRGSLLTQSNEFDQSHGRVSQTNYNAVTTNMGPPHQQGELHVAHFVTEEKIIFEYKDGRKVPQEELQTLEASDTGDAAEPDEKESEAPAAGPKPSDGGDKGADRPIKRKIKVRKEIPQNTIVRALADIELHLNYRQKGNAFYTCYDDVWKLEYTVKNRSDKTTEAEFKFPAGQSLYNRFSILVDGKDWAQNLVYKDGAQTWKMTMKPDQEVRVQISFASRGMEFVRYIPAGMATREECKVTMRIFPDKEKGKQRFVWKEDMSLPIGSMTPPTIKDSPADGEPMVLEWDLKSAATSLDMGVILPKIPQPGYYGARVLHEAPWGLMLLVAALVVTWMLLGREVDLFSLSLLSVAYYLFYTLVAYLSDHIAAFETCFVLAALATLVLAALYVWLGWGRNFTSHQTVALVAVLTIYYPLAVILDAYTGLMIQVLYWTLALYAAMLAVVMVWRRRRKEAA